MRISDWSSDVCSSDLKSTCAVHFAVALASQGWRSAGLDLDPRQRTCHRYLENRTNTAQRRAIDLPMPRFEVFEGTTLDELDAEVARLAEGADYFIADTPGRDDMFARHVAARADTLVTPINDSFIDFDLIGQVEPERFQVVRPSFYFDLFWDTSKTRAKADGRTIDWFVLRNRLRSEEHKSDLKSLMPLSFAAFCLTHSKS